MRRVLWMALLAMLPFAPDARAADYAGRLGIGYVSTSAPIGVRYWISSRIGIDAGVGFRSRDELNEATADLVDESVLTDTYFDVGLPINLIMRTRTNFFFRPGLLLGFKPEYVGAAGSLKTLQKEKIKEYSGLLGVEFWLWDHFSLTVAEGVVYTQTQPADPVVESHFELTHRALTLSNVGFHFYF
jgi:hypothetical protein